jgi:protein-arginine kinase activator protein McsA
MKQIKTNIKIMFILLIILTGNFVKAQNASDVFTLKEITWCGLDFSQAKMKGPGLETTQVVKDNLFKEWNDLIQKEKSKFNLRGFLKKKMVNFDLSAVEKVNNSVNPDNLISSGDYSIDISILGSLVKSYTLYSNSGVGLVFNIESFDRIIGKATLYATFFDLSTKKILFAEKMIGNGGGSSPRNYWANAIFHVFEQIDKKKYGQWKKQYGLMSGTAYSYPDKDINSNNTQPKEEIKNTIVKEENKQVKNDKPKKIDYTKLSSQDLKTQLDVALNTEDYKSAALIQQEIDNRAKLEKYSSMTTEDLNKQLKVALENEEYEKAAAIQAELDKRK